MLARACCCASARSRVSTLSHGLVRLPCVRRSRVPVRNKPPRLRTYRNICYTECAVALRVGRWHYVFSLSLCVYISRVVCALHVKDDALVLNPLCCLCDVARAWVWVWGLCVRVCLYLSAHSVVWYVKSSICLVFYCHPE